MKKETIVSLQNTRIKNVIRLLEKASERKKQGLTVIEGMRELMIAREKGIEPDTVFVCEEIAKPDIISLLDYIAVSKEVFAKMAYREGTEGVIALVKTPHISLDDIKLSENPLVIILESVEKPGNLGAILRTADAAKVDAVIICDPRTDIYNPNAIRSSVGCIFTNQIAASTTEEVMLWLKKNKIRSYAAALTATELYHQTDLSKSCAIVMGTEADGLTDKWLSGADEQIKIPMQGAIDSLNVSTSCAVIVFEAKRQRDFR